MELLIVTGVAVTTITASVALESLSIRLTEWAAKEYRNQFDDKLKQGDKEVSKVRSVQDAGSNTGEKKFEIKGDVLHLQKH